VGYLCTGIIVPFCFGANSPLQMAPSANVGLDGGIYSDCISNLLMYLGTESAVSSENPLKSLRIPADFDSTIRRFESSRPSQHLTNKIRHFLNHPDFHSDGRPISGIFPAATRE
jgi:hypothetical protein